MGFVTLALSFLPKLSLFSGLKSLFSASTLIMLLIAFVAGCGITWYTLTAFYKADTADTLSVALELRNEAIRDTIERGDEIRRLDLIEFEKQLAQAKVSSVVTKTITEEVIVYVPETNDCNYSFGAIGLLNIARQPWLGSSLATLPTTAGLSDETLRTTSSFTQRDEVKAHAACATQYNDLAVKHDALIDWLEKINK